MWPLRRLWLPLGFQLTVPFRQAKGPGMQISGSLDGSIRGINENFLFLFLFFFLSFFFFINENFQVSPTPPRLAGSLAPVPAGQSAAGEKGWGVGCREAPAHSAAQGLC